MEIVIKILQAILSLSLLVFIHELGHFIFARMFGVRVEKFYIFFDAWGVSLLKFRVGGTEFGIGWIPFGGYCKISGMIDESMDTAQLKGDAQPWEFRTKPAWQRLLIMTGGVIMNVVLAAAIYIGISHRWGDRYVAAEDVVYGYAFSDLGREAGFENGDRILSVGGQRPEMWQDVLRMIILDNLPPVEAERGGELLTVQIPRSLAERVLGDRDFIYPRVPFVVAQVPEGSGAHAAGVAVGDSLVAVDGRAMMFYDEFTRAFRAAAGRTVELVVSRDGVLDTLSAAVSPEGLLGVNTHDYQRFLPVRTRHYTFMESIPAGIERAGERIAAYWKNLKLLVKPDTGAYKSVGGFISIGNLFPGQWNWAAFWDLTALLSVMLAVANILPIPALDGGHVLFLLYEVVTRRKPSDKFLERAQVVGLFILLAILLAATWNDIYRFFIK
jgi:regulator of sigma E protease